MQIISISVDNRVKEIPEVQDILTEYGNDITARLGIHNPKKENQGVVIVAYIGEKVDQLIEDLNAIQGVDINDMEV